MMKTGNKSLIAILLLLFLIFKSSILWAQTAGRITGKVIDYSTGDPLIGANVMLTGTRMGSATDIRGHYNIINVSPGTYTLRVTYIGYRILNVEDVRVNVDLTTTIDVELEPAEIMGEAVTVIAERPLVIRDLTATTAILSSDDISSLPINEISDAIQLQAGMVRDAGGGLHIRGGRSGEISYMIDGMPVTDVYDGGSIVDVNVDMVQQLQVISGAFNAEYGQAMSGIVNITTKEGDNTFGGSFTTYLGDNLSTHKDIFMNIDDFNPVSINNFEGSLYGPVIKNKLFFHVNARSIYFDGWLHGQRRYNPNAVSGDIILPKELLEDIAPDYLDHGSDMGNGNWGFRYVLGSNDFIDSLAVQSIYPQDIIAHPDSFSYYYQKLKNNHQNGKGDNAFVPMNWNRKKYAQAKFVYLLMPNFKVTYNFIFDDVQYNDFERDYIFNPDGASNKFRTGRTQIFQINHLLNEKTFYNLGISYFDKGFKRFLYEDKFDSRYVHPFLGIQEPYSFKTGGTSDVWFQRQTRTLLAKFILTSQITPLHLVKFGVEYRKHKLNQTDITLRPVAAQTDMDPAKSDPFIQTRVMDQSTMFHSRYTQSPMEFSAFLQDKIEYRNFIVNIGIRFDYFNPDGRILRDESDPNIYNPIRPENRFHDWGTDGIPNTFDPDGTENNAIHDPGEPLVTFEERLANWYKKTTPKYGISPRLGVSFPITDRGIIHFSYGHFLQIPRFEHLYHNPDFKLGSGTGNVGIIGNADMEPEKTISGELGLQQQLTDNIAVNTTIFFRDIRNLTGTRADEIVIFGGAARYSKFSNSDFGFIRGIILAFNKRFSNNYAATLDYTYQIAKGSNSNPEQARNALAAGILPEIQLLPLDWDQTHTVNASFTYGGKDWGASIIGQWGSGLPFTPRATVDISTFLTNSRRKPGFTNVDMRAYKDFYFGPGRLTVFMRVFNVFDTLNEVNVFNDTGRAGTTGDKIVAARTNPAELVNSLDQWFTIPTHYGEPRRIEMGLTYSF